MTSCGRFAESGLHRSGIAASAPALPAQKSRVGIPMFNGSRSNGAAEPVSAAVLDVLDFATAMMLLVAPVDNYPIAEQCKHIKVARSQPAGVPRGNVGMLLGLSPWTTIVNTYLTAMLKEKEHESAKTALLETLSEASSDAAAGVVTNAVQKIHDWREAATRDEWRRPLADAIWLARAGSSRASPK